MMYVLRDGPLAFLAHPRTASRATRDALKEIGFIAQGKHHAGPPEHDLGGRVAFCTVRNPWDAMVSWFFNFAQPVGQDFSAKWLRNHVSKHPSYFHPEGLWWFTFLHPQPRILRYEQLQQDLDQLCDDYDLDRVVLDRVGVSDERKGRHYRDFYDSHSAALVRDLWGDEIDLLGYEY